MLERVAEGVAIYVDHDKCDEFWVSLLDPGKVSIASLDVLLLDRRKLRKRNHSLTNALDDLLLLSGSELGAPAYFVRYFNFACATQVDFIVRLYRDCRQHSSCHQRE